LRDCTKSAFKKALRVAKAGQPINLIGKAIEKEVRRYGFSVMMELSSHGVGRDIHEPPSIPNYFDKRLTQKLTDGLVITIEPIISATTNWSRDHADGWTIASRDGSLTSHYEHTIIITQGRPIVVTALN
jgi:methionyl aminopeptidase